MGRRPSDHPGDRAQRDRLSPGPGPVHGGAQTGSAGAAPCASSGALALPRRSPSPSPTASLSALAAALACRPWLRGGLGRRVGRRPQRRPCALAPTAVPVTPPPCGSPSAWRPSSYPSPSQRPACAWREPWMRSIRLRSRHPRPPRHPDRSTGSDVGVDGWAGRLGAGFCATWARSRASSSGRDVTSMARSSHGVTSRPSLRACSGAQVGPRWHPAPRPRPHPPPGRRAGMAGSRATRSQPDRAASKARATRKPAASKATGQGGRQAEGDASRRPDRGRGRHADASVTADAPAKPATKPRATRKPAAKADRRPSATAMPPRRSAGRPARWRPRPNPSEPPWTGPGPGDRRSRCARSPG